MSTTYRDYQLEVASIATDALDGIQRQMLVLATGSGKSITIKKIIEDLLTAGRGPLLVIVHKRELVDQLADTMRLTGRRVVVERAEQVELQEADEFDICVASIQTLQKRPEVLDPINWDVVFIDETHRALADGYLDVLERIGVLQEDGPRLIGCTATDYRGDDETGESLFELYESVPYKRDLVDFIKDAWLVPLKARRPAWRQINEGRVEDVVADEALEGEDFYALVFDTFVEECVDSSGAILRPTLGMTANVTQGREIAEYFTSRGVRAEMVDSKMDQKLRAQFIQEFRDGGLDVLFGYDVLIEGFDSPRASCLLWLRHTSSPVVFVQGLGRITRPLILDPEAFEAFNASTDVEERRELIENSEKKDALFLDFTDVSSRYNVITLGRQLDLAKDFDFDGENVLDVVEEINELVESYPLLSTDSLHTAADIGRVTEDVEIWREAIAPNTDVPENAQAVWTKHRNTWTLTFPVKTEDKTYEVQWIIKISQAPRGEWEVAVGQPEVWKQWYWNGQTHKMKYYKGTLPPPQETVKIKYQNNWKTVERYVQISGMPFTTIETATTKAEAFYLAEQFVYDTFPESVWRLVHKDAPWRQHEPSKGQLDYIDKMRREGIAIPEVPTKSIASILLDYYFLGVLKPIKLTKRGKKRRTAKTT